MQVTLERDTKKREYTIPAHIEEALKAAGALDAFMKLPDYEKREKANHIELAKKEETRVNRLNVLIKLLNETNI